MAGQSRSQSKRQKTLSIQMARYVAMMPLGVPVSIHDVSRAAGKILPSDAVRKAFAKCVLNGHLEYIDGKLVRRLGAYGIADIDLPYAGKILPMPATLTNHQRALFTTLKVDTLVVLGRAFLGAFVIDCADGARLRPGHQSVQTVRSLWRQDALTLICSDDFATYLSVTLDGTSIKRSTDILSA